MKLVGHCTALPLIVLLLLPLFTASTPVESKNILFFWGVSGYSHRISVWPIIDKLLEKGHLVTFISPFESKTPSAHSHPNLTDIVPSGLVHDIGLASLDFISIRLDQGVQGTDDLWSEYYESGIRGCASMMRNKKVLEWINSSSYDLVIVDALFNECGYGMVYKFQAPLIMYSPTSHFSWFKDAYGLPDENLPEMQYHYPLQMTFLQSVHNLLSSLYWQAKRHYDLFPKIEKMLKSALNLSNLPSLDEIERGTSIIFTSTDPSEEFPRSVPKNCVEIAGIHCNDDRKPLPQELEDFIASGENGFILVTFGTYASISSLPLYLQHAFFDAMRALPQFQFIIRFDKDPPSGMSKNVMPLKWLQQQDLIAHPKCVAFIGHGGLLGTQEAVYHAVSMIVIPLFAEQDYQAVRANERETAIALELGELTEKKLISAILELTTNPKYQANTMKLSKLFRDRQNEPLETAMFHIEYVMRHKNLGHLRPIGINKTWYQRRNLDIWGFIIICVICGIAGVGAALYLVLSTIVVKVLKKIKPKQA